MSKTQKLSKLIIIENFSSSKLVNMLVMSSCHCLKQIKIYGIYSRAAHILVIPIKYGKCVCSVLTFKAGLYLI